MKQCINPYTNLTFYNYIYVLDVYTGILLYVSYYTTPIYILGLSKICSISDLYLAISD